MSNQTRTPIETVRRILSSKMHNLRTEIAKSDAKIAEGFLFAFKWGYLSDKYKKETYLNHLSFMFERSLEPDFIDFLINYYKLTLAKILSYNPTSISTSQSSNLATQIEHTVNVELLELCDTLIQEMNETI